MDLCGFVVVTSLIFLFTLCTNLNSVCFPSFTITFDDINKKRKQYSGTDIKKKEIRKKNSEDFREYIANTLCFPCN